MTPPGLLLLVLVACSGRAPDFDTEILPVLTRAGCNSGACHGAAAGRGGFRLSLLGGDPAADHDAIVHELESRRVNLARADQSLLLTKPTGQLAHKGGLRLDPTGAGARRLTEWIASGARRGKPRRLTHFEVRPAETVVEKLGSVVPLRATARFDEGKPEDVTAWTVFQTGDSAALELEEDGRVTVRRRGQHVVTARFLDRVVSIRLTMPLRDPPVDLSGQPRANFIDEEVYRTLTLLRLPVSPRTDDAAFLRRVRLDLTGRLPTPEEVKAFVQDRSSNKRAQLVDRLLASEAFVEYWTHRLAILFRVRSLAGEKAGLQAFHHWIHQQLAQGVGLDQMARSLLTAVGDSHRNGPANFTRLAGDARQHAELVSQVFLGVRLQCANCHNHPLDRWTQDDYHGLAAVFARLERGRIVQLGPRGAVTHPRTGEPAIPRIPGVRSLNLKGDPREPLANWLTARDNPYFARAAVNRLWKALLGRGLVEPEDDLRDTNPATHPRLLDRLAADFVEHGYDLRHTLRRIACSETYGRSRAGTSENQADDRFYSRAYPRALSAEVLADALADVTGVSDRYGDLPLGTRAIALKDPATPAPSLDILGRCSRQGSCDEPNSGGGLAAKLHRLNGELINRKITAREGRLHRLLTAGKSNETILEEFYLRALGRPPVQAEREHWLKQLADATSTSRAEIFEDIVWALLNGRDFSTNH